MAEMEMKHYTLSEVAQRTGISMPTLQHYGRLYRRRIPTVGTGRQKRYPEDALPVFEEIQKTAEKKATRQVKAAAKKTFAKVMRKARKRSVVKSTAPPHTAAEIRDLLGITEKDMRAARRWLQSTAEEPVRQPRGKTVGGKRATAR